MMYGSYDGDVWTHVGTAVRLGDHLVCTMHQVRDYNRVLLTKKPLVEANSGTLVVRATEDLKELPPAADVLTLRLTEAEFSRIGLKVPRIGGVDGSRTTVALACAFAKGNQISFGELTTDLIWGQVAYTGSTMAGCSGAAYYVGNLVYGLHMCGGQDNLGYSASYLMSLLKTQEETAEWLEKLFRTNRRARWKYEPARGAYSVYDGYQFHTVEEDVFQDWEEDQNRWERDREDDGWAGEGRDYKQGEQAAMLEETAAKLRRKAAKTNATGLKQHYEQRADEYSEQAFNFPHMDSYEPEGLTNAQKELLPESLRYQVGSAEPQYQDAPEELAYNGVEEHVGVLTEAASSVAKEAISLNARAAVEGATAEALQQISRQKEEVLQTMEELMRMAREHRDMLKQLYVKQDAKIQRLKTEPGTVETQAGIHALIDAKMATATKLTLVNATVKAAEPLVMEAKVKPKKLKSAARRKQRSEKLQELLEANNLDLPELMRMVVAAGGLSSAGIAETLGSVGLQVMPVLAEAKNSGILSSMETTSKSSSIESQNETAAEATQRNMSHQKPVSDNSVKVSATTPRSKTKPDDRSSNPAGSSASK